MDFLLDVKKSCGVRTKIWYKKSFQFPASKLWRKALVDCYGNYVNLTGYSDESPIDIVGKTIGNAYFDEIIGHIENIVLSEQFVRLHNDFLERYYLEFEGNEENRLEYMDIYLEYVNFFENFLSEKLHEQMAHFDMQRFADELSLVADSTNESNYDEIFELLHSLNSFTAFKELMLDYRRSKDRKAQNLDFDSILVTKGLLLNKEPTDLV